MNSVRKPVLRPGIKVKNKISGMIAMVLGDAKGRLPLCARDCVKVHVPSIKVHGKAHNRYWLIKNLEIVPMLKGTICVDLRSGLTFCGHIRIFKDGLPYPVTLGGVYGSLDAKVSSGERYALVCTVGDITFRFYQLDQETNAGHRSGHDKKNKEKFMHWLCRFAVD